MITFFQADMKVDDLCQALWQSCKMQTSKGGVTANSLKGAPIK